MIRVTHICSDVLLRSGAELERAAALARSEATVLRASAAAAGIAHAAVRHAHAGFAGPPARARGFPMDQGHVVDQP